MSADLLFFSCIYNVYYFYYINEVKLYDALHKALSIIYLELNEKEYLNDHLFLNIISSF